MTPNTEWKKVAASLAATVLFAVICLASLTFMDGMDGGYAVAFIAFFLAVSGIAVGMLFFHRARAMDAILADPSPLAHWTYPEEESKAHVEREYQDFRERNRAMFIVIGGMLAVVALFFIVFVEDGGLETGLILLAIAVLLFAVSRITPWLERRRAEGAPAEAYIGRIGIIYRGSVYPFRSFLRSRPGVSYRKGKKGPDLVVFSFVQLVSPVVIQPFDITIPVPPGEEENARRIVIELGGNASTTG